MRCSQLRIVDAEGAVVREGRVPTTPERLVVAFGDLSPMRILLETGTESEWVAQALEGAGHEVIVADPNYAPMSGELRWPVKADRRDGAVPVEANRRGWYRATHRVSAPQLEIRQVLWSRRPLAVVAFAQPESDSVCRLARSLGLRRGAVGGRLAPIRTEEPRAGGERVLRCGRS